ncbi:MAG: hypothetical protein J6C64_10160 [Lachnospiraceae bacterium]|nr:hypothetical protein [Lachnospiraceae bacterium]
MAILKCKMCGGTMDYDKAQNLAVCSYCGSKSTVFEQDRKLYEQFQNMFSALLNQEIKKAPEEGFFVEASREEFLRNDGETIEVNYLTKRKTDICTMYVTRKNVIYIFEKQYEKYAMNYLDMTGKIAYPNEEMEKELRNYVPKYVTDCRLEDGSIFIAIEKREGTYPIRMLGILLDRHVAWVISRLENLCCLLHYNDMVLNGLTADNLFADPVNHQIYLYGGWWFAGFCGAEISGASADVKPYLENAKGRLLFRQADKRSRNSYRTDLEGIRVTASALLGYSDREMLKADKLLPAPFRKFLLTPPEADARADFRKWDKVLTESYGERKFIPLSVTEEEIYSGRK